MALAAHSTSGDPPATGRSSATPHSTVIRRRAHWNNRRSRHTARITADGSTATTWAPRFAASMVAGPMPAPTAKPRSPGFGSAKSTRARLRSDDQNFRIFHSQWSSASRPLS